MEKNNHIFLAGGDALVYLAEPVHQKYSTTFFWGNAFSTYVYYDRFFNPLVRTCAHFARSSLYSTSCVRLNGMLLSTKKQIRTFEYRIH